MHANINEALALNKGIGNINNAMRPAEVFFLLIYFQDLKSYADPLTVKLILSQYGTEARGQAGTVCLPPHHTKLGI